MQRTIYDAATDTFEVVTVPDEPRNLEVERAAKLAALADRRWQAETSGFVWGVYWIATDRESQSKIAAERQAAENGTHRPGDLWKCGDVSTGDVIFVPMSDSDVIAISEAARNHVSDTYNIEGLLDAAIRAAPDVAALDAIDIDTGWPTNTGDV